MKKRIVISAPEPERFTIDLVGKEYLIRAPKAALAMRLAEQFGARAEGAEMTPEQQRQMLDGINLWLDAAFGKKQAGLVRKRLNDPDDLLDFEQIMELVSAVYEDETGDPPTSPRA